MRSTIALTTLFVPIILYLYFTFAPARGLVSREAAPSLRSAHDTTSSPPRGPSRILDFELRHVHAVSRDAQVLFKDVPPWPSRPFRFGAPMQDSEQQSHMAGDGFEMVDNRASPFRIKTRRVKTFKPPSFDIIQRAREWSREYGLSLNRHQLDNAPAPETHQAWTGERDWENGWGKGWGWEEDEVEGPDVESRETLLQLAKMTNNAYVEFSDPAWYDLGEGWNISYPFGWEPDADGFRGHVFATPDNSTVVLSIKGTSAAVLGGGGPTVKKDKFNDNLLFSCCCARVDWTWTTVCGCHKGGYKCDLNCLEKALIDESLFYPIGTNLYYNLTYMYPKSTIWITGHSLGGALGGLLGVTFGTPVVSFESPGEKMASRRLHLPSPPSTQHITHVFHTADPIAMGTCNGVLSSCALGGYAMESRCHLGESIIYDTVSRLGWTADIRTHGIVSVIEKLLSSPWEPSVEEGREVPRSEPQDDCQECYSWDYIEK